jgi:valyl-tRNA synthetase
MTLAKAYNSKDVEDKWYSYWEKNNLFLADENSSKPPYCIVIPPPNVTGVLTMGHVLNNTIQDIMIRRKRMQGFEVLWLPGTDHAGIATQTVVEKALKKEGKIKHRDDLGREGFIKKTWEWKDRHGGIIIKQLKKLGCSCDWSREVFTMDGLDPRHPDPQINYSQCVKEVFVKLYEKKLIYRGRRMVNWCPVSRTALSDEEVEMKEVDGHLWHIKYPLLDESGKPAAGKFIVVATTRPETMLGDEAVAVNPKDERYKNLIGRKVLLPLKSKPIPIIADEAVDLSFGTGAVKVTPAHDPADYDIAVRHGLPLTVVIGEDGTMTESAGEKYEGLDRFECRRAVAADLEEWGLMLKVEPYRHNVGFSQRADVPIEPMLSEQWFLKYPQTKKGLKAVLGGDIKFWPDRWVKVYEHWMENLKDWCISRQLWWGHRIPVWYCKKSEVRGRKPGCPPIVSLEQPTKCPKCGGTNLVQDEDVLDTWFSSWLWPFAAMGWPKKTALLKKFYPTSDLVTGPDIIFFWVARMIMAGFEFMGAKPFSNVYFTGIIRDALGRKMSKSLGNSPDPLDLINAYGADGLRFGLMLIAPQGQDILFSQDRIETGRNFCNKLWNAARFVLMNLEQGQKSEVRGQKSEINPPDQWILNRLEHTIRETNEALDHYDFDGGARILYQFVWRDFCDWYVEFSKVHFYGDDAKAKAAAQKTSLTVLTSVIKLLHPYMPFITEELWQQLKEKAKVKGAKSIMFDSYPEPSKKLPYEDEAQKLETVKNIIDAIRNIRGEHNIKPQQKIDAAINTASRENKKIIEDHRLYIEKLASLKSLVVSEGAEKPKDVATAVVGGMEILVPWKGLIDVEAEKSRLTKEIAKVQNDTAILKKKLSNESFVAKAPPDVVSKEREKLIAAEEKLKKLQDAMDKLS